MSESHTHDRYIPSRDESRWADPEEIKRASTIEKINIRAEECHACGLPIISDGRHVHVDNSDTHTLVLGATGSKKTRLFGMPLINMFALAGESFIATDPKGELEQKTSGLVAAKGYNKVVLDLRDLPKSSLWNPLQIPHELYHCGRVDEAVGALSDFLSTLAEPQRNGAKDPYWVEMSYSYALAFMLFFIETATLEEANIYNFANFCATNSTPEATEEIVQCIAEGSIAHVNFSGVLTNKEARSTFGNVASGVSNMINPFIIRKTLCQVLSDSSFNIRSIGKEKTAIYIIVPDEKTTLHFLLTAFIKQSYEVLINEAQQQDNKKLPVRLNFLLDEFCNLPTIPDMASMISAARSRNMRFFLMVQGMYQLQHRYKEDADTIKGNCDNWVFLTSREYELLNEIRNLCGDTFYVDSEGNTKPRPLISISELQRLSKERGEALILHGRHYPFVTSLPDIDSYEFMKYAPDVAEDRQLPQITPYNVNKVLTAIKGKKRPIPFSVEVFGREMYSARYSRPKDDVFDW